MRVFNCLLLILFIIINKVLSLEYKSFSISGANCDPNQVDFNDDCISNCGFNFLIKELTDNKFNVTIYMNGETQTPSQTPEFTETPSSSSSQSSNSETPAPTTQSPSDPSTPAPATQGPSDPSTPAPATQGPSDPSTPAPVTQGPSDPSSSQSSDSETPAPATQGPSDPSTPAPATQGPSGPSTPAPVVDPSSSSFTNSQTENLLFSINLNSSQCTESNFVGSASIDCSQNTINVIFKNLNFTFTCYESTDSSVSNSSYLSFNLFLLISIILILIF